MTTFTFDTTVPAANNAPKNDQPIMQINNASTAGLIAVDHVGFNFPDGGYHKIIHQTPQSDPVSIPSIGQLYSKLLSGNTQLFYESSNGVITQLTGPSTTTASFNGYTYLPGGILLQWGFQNGTHSGINHTFNPGDTGIVTFPIPFPNNVFNITTNVNYNSTTAGIPASSSALIIAPNYSASITTGFQWFAAGSGGSYTVFYWLAIGF